MANASAPLAAHPRFVELVRVSSQGQADRDTPEDQRAALKRLRLQRPGSLVEVIEFAVSGAKDTRDRPDIQRLAKLADAVGFDEVRVRHLDRLTRHADPDEQEAVFSIIRRAHAVIVEADGAVTDPRTLHGRIISMIKAEGAAEERRKIVERTRAAKQRLAEQGWLVNAQPPFGRYFDRKEAVWKKNEQSADYARLFDLARAGNSLRKIAAILNSEGVPGPRGRPWRWTSIYDLIRHPSAVGRYTTMGVSVSIPPIVDEATQRAALETLRQNNKLSGPKPKVFVLLRKIMVCAVCEGSIYAAKCGGTKGATRVYFCSRGCGKGYPGIPVQRLDEHVVTALSSVISEPGRLERLLRAAAADKKQGSTRSASAEIASAEKQLRVQRQRLENLVRLYTSGEIEKELFDSQKKEIEALRRAAEARRDHAQAEVSAADRAKANERDLKTTIKAIRDGMADASTLLWVTPQDDEEKLLLDRLRERWRHLLESWFPRGSMRLHPDGALDLSGWLTVPSSLEASGDSRAART